MVSDYSSIAYDYLLLNRPIVYLIPDYEEYVSERGFVFHNIDMFMPGEKVRYFKDMLSALEEAFNNPEKYEKERESVLAYRFDFMDDQSSRRCYETIINYRGLPEKEEKAEEITLSRYPSSAELLKKHVPETYEIIDSTKPVSKEQQLEAIGKNPAQRLSLIHISEPTRH